MAVFIHRLPIRTPGSAPRCTLYLWGEDDSIPVEEFLRDLNKSRPDDFNRLGVLFRRMIEVGKITNQEHFKDVEGHKPLFEFKGRGVRIYCFFDGSDVILLEGDIKKSDKSKDRNRQSIARAERRVELYRQEKATGRLEVRK